MTYCFKCKKVNENGALFCITCGNVIAPNENPYVNNVPLVLVNNGSGTGRCRNCQNDFSLLKEEGKCFCPYCGYPHIKNF